MSRPSVRAVTVGLALLLAGAGASAGGPSGASGRTATVARLPRLGHTILVTPVSGIVFVRQRGARGFTRLRVPTDLRVGSAIDTRHGSMDVTEASAVRGPRYTATVGGGEAIVTQAFAIAAPTVFRLSAPLNCPAGSAIAASRRPAAKRHLKVRETGGNWDTEGQYVVTAAEGTIWTTTDTCGASTVTVQAGIVRVTNLITHALVTLSSGERLAVNEFESEVTPKPVVSAEPAFTIQKEQKLEGEASYTKNKLVGKVGQTVDYEIVVDNTGNVELSLGALGDPNCTNIAPSGAVKLAVGASQTYTCEHKGLAVGAYTNAASIANAGEGAKESNKVEVQVLAEPAFTIQKEQRFEGEASYTKGKLIGKVGQSVDYRVVVQNTGNVELSLGALGDPNCTNIAPSGAVKLALGASQTYTCEHKGLAVGAYTNTATIANAGEGTKESNKVEAEVPAEAGFTIEKEQKFEVEATYTKSAITGKRGQTVDYEILVKNTGNVELTLGALSDPDCTNIAPSGSLKLALGASQSYTCEHRELAVGPYANVATMTDNFQQSKESNRVEANGL